MTNFDATYPQKKLNPFYSSVTASQQFIMQYELRISDETDNLKPKMKRDENNSGEKWMNFAQHVVESGRAHGTWFPFIQRSTIKLPQNSFVSSHKTFRSLFFIWLLTLHFTVHQFQFQFSSINSSVWTQKMWLNC